MNCSGAGCPSDLSTGLKARDARAWDCARLRRHHVCVMSSARCAESLFAFMDPMETLGWSPARPWQAPRKEHFLAYIYNSRNPICSIKIGYHKNKEY